MDVYSYRPDTGEYVGVTQADKCQVWTPERPAHEEFLHPAFTTPVKPPNAPAGFCAAWDASAQKWNLVEDHRGETWYLPNRTTTVIATLGPVDPSLSRVQPSRLKALKKRLTP